MTAVFYWEDVVAVESDYSLNFVDTYYWADADRDISKQASALTDRIIVDVKINCYSNAMASFVSKKSDQKLT